MSSLSTIRGAADRTGRDVAAGMGSAYPHFGAYQDLAAFRLAGIFARLWDRREETALVWTGYLTIVLSVIACAWALAMGGEFPGASRSDNRVVADLAEVALFYVAIAWVALLASWLSRRSARTSELRRWMTTAMWAAASEDLRLRGAAAQRAPQRAVAPVAVSHAPVIGPVKVPSYGSTLAAVRESETVSADSARSASSRRLVRPVDRPRNDGLFHVRFLVGPSGQSITSESREEWLRARRTGVTATDCNKIVLKSGRPSTQRAALLDAKLDGERPLNLAAFAHGIKREPVIAEWVWQEFGVVHNQAICRGDTHRHLATPDGIGDGVIAEIKTAGKPLDQAVRTYSDQLQWQLHVTSSERVLFVVENRVTFERETRWVWRDEERIATLAKHADLFLDELDDLAEARGR